MLQNKEKVRAHRKKTMESVKLLQPVSTSPSAEKVKEKIKVPTKSRSALIGGEGRSMGMDIDG